MLDKQIRTSPTAAAGSDSSQCCNVCGTGYGNCDVVMRCLRGPLVSMAADTSRHLLSGSGSGCTQSIAAATSCFGLHERVVVSVAVSVNFCYDTSALADYLLSCFS